MKRTRSREFRVAAAATTPAAKRTVNITSSEPARLGLLALPLELLEEISHFFRREEAVVPLAVCSVLNAVFARRIWHTIGCAPLDNRRRIPGSAWQRYGHLVRHAHISLSASKPIPLFRIPDVVRLAVDLDCVQAVFGSEAVADMRHLHRVAVHNWSSRAPDIRQAKMAVNWAANALQLHERRVEFEWLVSVGTGSDLLALCDFAGYIDDTSQHAFAVSARNIRSDSPPPTLHRLAPLMTSLEVAGQRSCVAFFGGSGGGSNNGSNNGSGIVFPRLARLSLLLDSGKSLSGALSTACITPVRCPALRSVKVSFASKSHSTLQHLLGDSVLPSVAELTVCGCSSAPAVMHLLQRFPCAARLLLARCTFPLSSDAVSSVDVRQDGSDCGRLSVCAITLHETSAAAAECWLALFPNTRQLTLTDFDESADLHELRSRHPRLAIRIRDGLSG